MASHPYISGPGNITQMVGFLKKNFPATVTSETVKKLGLASNNESYVINALQFVGIIDEEGKRTERGHEVMTTHDESAFQKGFQDLVRAGYKDLFDIRGEDAWTLSKDELIGYFRTSDKTSEVIGSRQAGVFQAFRSIAGHEQIVVVDKKTTVKKSSPKTAPAKQKPSETVTAPPSHAPGSAQQTKTDMALTVRIEINLPAEGTQETYDAIFKSIKANLYP